MMAIPRETSHVRPPTIVCMACLFHLLNRKGDRQFPSVSSQNKDLLINEDGSVDVYFGPTAPAGKENNWVQTIPGKGWFMILRLYGPLESWFDKKWKPGEIELVR